MKFKQIYLEITKECNLHCSFCPAVFTKGQQMSIEQIKNVIENTKDFTDTYYLHILGEPLLYSNLSKVFELMELYKKKIKITTNGLLLAKYQNLIFSYSSVKQINISIQSWLNFSQDYQLELINNLTEFILKNQNKLTIMIRFWNDKNDDLIHKKNKFIFEQLMSNLKEDEFEMKNLSYMDLKLEKNLIRLRPYLFISLDDEFIWPSLEHQTNNNPNNCLGGKMQLGILNNGNVVLCCLDYLGHTKIGNIFEADLESILRDGPFLNFLESIKNHQSYFELCQKCDYRNRFN